MKNLDTARAKIDKIDKKIVELIADRTDHVYEIAQYKRKKNIEMHDPKREKEIIKMVREYAIENHVSENFIAEIYEKIFEYCRTITKIRN